MDEDPKASYFGKKHAALVNRIMRYTDHDVDHSIFFSWYLAKYLANGNVTCCIYVFMSILSCDIDYFERLARPRAGDPAITFFGLITLLTSNVLLVWMVYFNLIIRSSRLPNTRKISGWLLAHSSVFDFFVLYEAYVHGYVGGSFNSVMMGLLISVMLLFEAFVFSSLRKLLRYRMRHNNRTRPPVNCRRRSIDN